MSSQAVALLQQLIRNRCVNDGSPDSGNEHRSVETLADFFGIDGTVVEPHPGRQSVVYRIPGTDPDAPSLTLLPHLDVVPVTEDSWDHDPFGGDIIDGFVWGRGAVDMLNLAAAM
nr:M20/M25/M40 family metallo-hydrolase [Acidimicrobiia bacterium]